MRREELASAQKWVRSELDACLAFWLENGMDAVNGGIYTCLDRTGRVYTTDKSVWMQGRCAWTYAYMCSVYGVRKEWLAASKSCLDFMEAHCFNPDADGRMYFQVTAEGKPLRQRRYCFSEAFCAIANAEYYALTGDQKRIERARQLYERIYELNNGTIADPAGYPPKVCPQTRQSRSLADPMIYLNISSVMRRCDPEHAPLYDARSAACADTILRYHYKPELKCTLETVGKGGEILSECSAGRVVNPGHDIECSWFLLEYAKHSQYDLLKEKAAEMFTYAVEAGWDKTYGGLLYFLDAFGNPPEAYEHDMKLWWPHTEMLIASLMLYRETGNERFWEWFSQTLDYCKKVFSDPAYGEWYGYLRRDGAPTEPPCKGSTFKGPFHLPRALAMADTMLNALLQD
ncbi:Cellobiose 2-epimerase [bioreactor metagenome]|uniref:Cellobiose 2-epimerase n=1 Tax=bioreactor metagenome TaxID=1076179 RepID=A0A645C706_9ZZZZ